MSPNEKSPVNTFIYRKKSLVPDFNTFAYRKGKKSSIRLQNLAYRKGKYQIYHSLFSVLIH